MGLTWKQRAAIKYIAANPNPDPEAVLKAAEASTSGSNGAEFIWRLLMSGKATLDVPSEIRDAIDEGDEW